MNKLTICENLLEPSSWETTYCGDVRAFLKERFAEWPSTARIYLNEVCDAAEVTPHCQAEVDRLGTLQGHFYVVVYPKGIETIFIIIAIAIAAVSIGLSFLLRPKTPNTPNQQEQSPNNELTERQNKQRPNERIPDIYGKVWSTPDLIAVPYRVFEAGLEVEYAYYCIGVGNFTIHQVRDDITPYLDITGAQLEVYGPFNSPNNGAAPQLRYGAAINTPIKTIKSLSSINGQVLIAPNLTGAAWVGPFVMGDTNTTEIWVNFVAESGSYQVDSTTGIQTAVNTTIDIEITPVDGAGNPTGAPATHTVTLNGDAVLKSRVGVTLKITGLSGRYSIRAHRTSNTTISANTNVSDEIKWRDAMSITPVVPTDFGNVTTVQTRTLPTPDALALQARKLNLLVTRNVPIGTLAAGAVTFAPAGPSMSAADIIVAVCRDQFAGNRPDSEIDIVGIYTQVAAIATYFGTELCTRFCFTFDNSQTSFEEMLSDIATTVFSIAYRRGSVISIAFEKLTANSTLLFNHRNKIPGSETRTVTFGFANDVDGINFDYVEPNDPLFPNTDTPTTLYYPVNKSAINPQKVQSVGVRNNVQAYLLGWRLYNKLLFQNTVTQFEATGEANNCVRQDRILVADNTRPDTQDGEVVAQNALELELSQQVIFVVGRTYTIFLQLSDGSVETRAITAGSKPTKVILASAPSLPLVTASENFAKTGYMIVDDTPQRASAFLVSEKAPQNKMTYSIKAVNYDDRYYGNDQDFVNAVVVSNGEPGDSGLPIAPPGGGTFYRPSVYNDLGDEPSSGLSDTSGDVGGEWSPFPAGGFFTRGHVIWNGFPNISFTGNVTLTVVATYDADTLEVSLYLNGVLKVLANTSGSVGPVTYTEIIPAGTFLSSVSVEAFADGGSGPGSGGGSLLNASMSISDIYIS